MSTPSDAPTITTTWRSRLGRLGVWAPTDGMDLPSAVVLAERIEQLGYGALWLPETMGRDPFVHAAHLADRTSRLHFATGIANIHHRHPGAMLQASNSLAEMSGNRFLLAIGVSHQPLVEGMRGLDYSKPLATMRHYLEQMDASPYLATAPTERVPRLLAALGPKMLELSATHADGAHPYFTTPEHTERARSILGPDKLLCVEQKVVLTEDPAQGRETAIGALSIYADLPNYRNNWLRLGFTDAEIDAREPRFLDAVVAWGSLDSLRDRIRQHHDAGADHVCVQALTVGHPFRVDQEALAQLAPGG